MKFGNALLFFVVCGMSGYVSMSESSAAPVKVKKSLAEQCKALRDVDRAQRRAIFKHMKDGIQLTTIQELAPLEISPNRCSLYKGVNQIQSLSGKSAVSLNNSATIESTCFKATASCGMPSFAPLYKGVYHTLSPSGNKPISLLGRVLTKIPFQPDEEPSKNQLCIIASD